jgi:hypothetical protein
MFAAPEPGWPWQQAVPASTNRREQSRFTRPVYPARPLTLAAQLPSPSPLAARSLPICAFFAAQMRFFTSPN